MLRTFNLTSPKKEDKEADDIPDLYDLVEFFRNYEREYKPLEGTSKQGAAFATFNNRNEHGEKNDNNNPSDKPKCLCGRRHRYKDCYYLNPSTKPAWSNYRDQVIEKTKEKLKQLKPETHNFILSLGFGQQPTEATTPEKSQQESKTQLNQLTSQVATPDPTPWCYFRPGTHRSSQ